MEDIKKSTVLCEDIDVPEVEGYDIKRCQETLLRLLKTINSIFEKHGIQYVAAYGTLLGAIRHNGFIPWDDDLDIYIFKADYERALEALRADIPEDMIVHDQKTEPIYWTKWAKLRDLNTVTESALWPRNNTLKYRGLACDLFFIEYMAAGEYQYLEWRSRCGKWKKEYDSIPETDKKGFKGIGLKSKTLYYKAVRVLLRIWKNIYRRKVLVANKESILCEKYEIKDILNMQKHQFEDTYVYIPSNSDAVLKQLYGDYMKIPKYEDRKHHFKMVTFIDDK